jgi:HKD family nuclease
LKIILLWQGFPDCDNSVGRVLMDSFEDLEFDRFFCSVAFVRQSGITQLRDYIEKAKSHIKQFRIIVGVDQRGTSKEALETLLDLDVGTSIFHTVSPITFHPKVYFFEGTKRNQLIVGSSNFTQKGLFQNMETSLQVDMNSDETTGEDLLKQIHDYINQFVDNENSNVQRLTSKLIEELANTGLLPNESELQTENNNNQDNTRNHTNLKRIFPSMAIQKIPVTFEKTTFIRTVKQILYNFPEGIKSNEIYPIVEKNFPLTQKQKEQIKYGEPLSHHVTRATLNTLVGNQEAEHNESGKYILLPEIPLIDQESEEYITALIEEMRSDNSYFEDRRSMIANAQRLFIKLHQNQLSLAQFRNILTNTTELTGALGEKGIGQLNISRLCRENNISRINCSLRVLFNDSLGTDERVDRLLNDNERLSGGNIGFVSTMLFLRNSARYNIYNKKLLKGLQTVNPQIIEVLNGADYVEYNWAVLGFKKKFGLKDEEVDNILYNLSE